MELGKVNKIYFIGIGGIGMSALARYFMHIGKKVAGYDKTATAITENLQNEGAFIHFNEELDSLPADFNINKEDTLIIYTPAIPKEHKGYRELQKGGFKLYKRAEILGIITNNYRSIAVAGTHGKTSISTTVAHLLEGSNFERLAFLGGISKNYNSNLVLPESKSKECLAVVEADEFDRSFLHLSPNFALISAIDADHLDIYENKENIVKSFNHFIKKIATNGTIIYKKGLTLQPDFFPKNHYTYSFEEKADFCANNVRIDSTGVYTFDIKGPFGDVCNIESGVPGKVNAENALAACALAISAGVEEDVIRRNIKTFKGVNRRFDFHINNKSKVYVDDYAHHPEELKAFIGSVRGIFPGRKITGIFQPHLYSRTQDFAEDFAKQLDLLDEILLLDIYPARELPIKGVSSKLIYDKMKSANKELCTLNNLLEVLKNKENDIVLTMGAGNIDKKVSEIKELLS